MDEIIETRCAIAGGGPAGMMLGFLLARQGVDVVILEKHADFLRDFRGDTIHPSTLQLMHELGILGEFLQRPHQEVRTLSGQIGRRTVVLADFRHLPTECKFVALMPQWDFLDFIKEHAAKYPNFHLRMEAEVIGLIEENGAVQGLRAKTKIGELTIRAALAVGADGRRSTVRKSAGLPVIDLGAPMDVLWMRISRRPTDNEQTFGHIERGKMLVMLNRETYWQCAYVIPKGEGDNVKARGLGAFREAIADLEPILKDRVDELRDWSQVSLLSVAVDRLERWHKPGLLCIGDAAHAMSPIGGVGINLAIQDAVASSNLLGPILAQRVPSDAELHMVQQRRAFPTKATQTMQITIQNNFLKNVLGKTETPSLPWVFKLAQVFPLFRRVPARIVGLGFRPEHILR
jgi:2-polyprenyl-6-methoxyphenol hydroxylase-like FAD-dependent oxidoreductase